VSGGGYLSHSDSRILIALDPANSSADVEVTWPSGLHELFSGLLTRRDETLIEGRGRRLPNPAEPEAGRD
jgi:hypothetical protein